MCHLWRTQTPSTCRGRSRGEELASAISSQCLPRHGERCHRQEGQRAGERQRVSSQSQRRFLTQMGMPTTEHNVPR
ncbi:hypothetical protein Q5P01_022548 [Channa striata]|uniref:Uncharacterized protein n=1 Tax=Channa striata TaxID=64152 RepID=A0AA88IXZ0_CHASR|nr:hypothetical protein Q5P01_022548 [Channa striata]